MHIFRIPSKSRSQRIFFIFLVYMLFTSLYTIIKLSKTTSPQKLFRSDCITQYNRHIDTLDSVAVLQVDGTRKEYGIPGFTFPFNITAILLMSILQKFPQVDCRVAIANFLSQKRKQTKKNGVLVPYNHANKSDPITFFLTSNYSLPLALL